ncbi:hypothetical protein ACFRAR_10265 [Kitasatospora sp. NPDC056651]|uniref:hypothetical protein n=1 Tax=Kitasatospora sp. NPDC056651 TaxID=3345892 RepID=UPI003698C74E
MSEPPVPLEPDAEPARCKCGKLLRPDPPTREGFAGWSCNPGCGRFGYLMSPDYRGDDDRVQVCGRKHIASVPASAAA